MTEKPIYAVDDYAAIGAKLREIETDKHQAIATGQQEVTTITYTPPKRYRLAMQCQTPGCQTGWATINFRPKVRCDNCGMSGSIRYYQDCDDPMPDWIKGSPPV